jgi:hypothetical protein
MIDGDEADDRGTEGEEKTRARAVGELWHEASLKALMMVAMENEGPSAANSKEMSGFGASG